MLTRFLRVGTKLYLSYDIRNGKMGKVYVRNNINRVTISENKHGLNGQFVHLLQEAHLESARLNIKVIMGIPVLFLTSHILYVLYKLSLLIVKSVIIQKGLILPWKLIYHSSWHIFINYIWTLYMPYAILVF